MIDGNAIEAARKYIRENGPEGIVSHLNDAGFNVNAAQTKVILSEMLKEDGYTENEIKKALLELEDSL